MNVISIYFRFVRDFMWKKLKFFGINYNENNVPAYTLPDLLQLSDGGIVTQAEVWKGKRRPEILSLFQHYVYGQSIGFPKFLESKQVSKQDNALGGLATRIESILFLPGRPEGPAINLLLYLPNSATGPVPVFLGLNFNGNHTINSDPGINITRQWHQLKFYFSPVEIIPLEETRGASASRWPVEKILYRGYALATAYYGDVEPDFPDGWRYGFRSYLGSPTIKTKKSTIQDQKTSVRIRQSIKNFDSPSVISLEETGSIAVWSWGLSRILDFLVNNSRVCASKVAVIGHSRLGKTALWAGAQDERFAAVISNNSGCGGAALSRRRFGETVRLINRSFPHWFCGNFKKFNGIENKLPVDQHMLIALMAPRPVYIASAAQDMEADPLGEFLSAKLAGSVYDLFGLMGVGVDQIPRLNEVVGEKIGYHIRDGKHDVTEYDWDQFLSFVDRHFVGERMFT